MSHSKKPGTPGKTTIPPEIVSAATMKLAACFRGKWFTSSHDLFVVPRQCYLYVETRRRQWDDAGPRPPMDKDSTTHRPLGRLKYVGDPDVWEYHRYIWSNEYWDERLGVETGTIKQLVDVMIL